MTPPAVHPFLLGLLQGKDWQDLAAFAREDRDWLHITEDATAQGLLPLLYCRVSRSDRSPKPPAARLAQIKAYAVGCAARNALLAHELTSILQHVEARLQLCMPLRGFAVAEHLYEDTGLRPMGDLDLLAPHHALPVIVGVLKGLGYHELDRRPGFARAYSYTLEFYKDRFGWVTVEPHWTIAYPPFCERVDMDAVWARCQRGTVAGVSTRLLSPTDLFLHLCFHLIHKGVGAPLLWLYDLDRLLRKDQAVLDWSLVLAVTRQSGQAPFVAEVLSNLNALFGSPFPNSITAQLMTRPANLPNRSVTRPRIEGRLVRLLTERPGLDGRESVALLFTIKGIYPKLRYALGILFPSPEFMRLHYGLPSRGRLGLSYLTRLGSLLLEGFKSLLALTAPDCARVRPRAKEPPFQQLPPGSP